MLDACFSHCITYSVNRHLPEVKILVYILKVDIQITADGNDILFEGFCCELCIFAEEVACICAVVHGADVDAVASDFYSA